MQTVIRHLKSLLALLACAGVIALAPARLLAAEEHGAAAAHAAAPAAAGHEAAAAGEAHHTAGPDAGDFLTRLGYSYLTAYMFCLSLCMGCLFLVLVHHLFDAGWSVPVRRITETVSSLMFPWMLILLVPILVLAKRIYPWLSINPESDHALDVKKALFNPGMFYVFVPVLVASWGLIARRFLSLSVAQDKDGAATWTRKARVQAAWGIFYFAFTLTLGCFYLMKSLQHQFFSTMYGVYYFAGSVWTTFATVYVILILLSRPGALLEKVIFKRQIQDVGVLFFAFTVFYAYIHFSQYFLIWNAAIPEETFWYVRREAGSWKWVGMTILFGHFFLPFLCMLNQDIKRNLAVMIPMAAWAWLMHYTDMTFNVMPVLYPEGLSLSVLDPVLWFGMAGLLAFLFKKEYAKNAPYPLRDPRLKEAVTHHEVPGPGEAAAHH